MPKTILVVHCDGSVIYNQCFQSLKGHLDEYCIQDASFMYTYCNEEGCEATIDELNRLYGLYPHAQIGLLIFNTFELYNQIPSHVAVFYATHGCSNLKHFVTRPILITHTDLVLENEHTCAGLRVRYGPLKSIVSVGYCDSDHLLSEPLYSREKVCNALYLDPKTPIVLIALTWPPAGRRNLEETRVLYEEISKIPNHVVSPHKSERVLKKRNVELAHIHVNMCSEISTLMLFNEQKQKQKQNSNPIIGIGTRELLKHADVLVSDSSSVLFEYLSYWKNQRPIVQLLHPITSDNPTKPYHPPLQVGTMEPLVLGLPVRTNNMASAVSWALQNPLLYSEQRQRFASMNIVQPKAAQRIVKHIYEFLQLASRKGYHNVQQRLSRRWNEEDAKFIVTASYWRILKRRPDKSGHRHYTHDILMNQCFYLSQMERILLASKEYITKKNEKGKEKRNEKEQVSETNSLLASPRLLYVDDGTIIDWENVSVEHGLKEKESICSIPIQIVANDPNIDCQIQSIRHDHPYLISKQFVECTKDDVHQSLFYAARPAWNDLKGLNILWACTHLLQGKNTLDCIFQTIKNARDSDTIFVFVDMITQCYAGLAFHAQYVDFVTRHFFLCWVNGLRSFHFDDVVRSIVKEKGEYIEMVFLTS